MDATLMSQLLDAQRNEMTEHLVYAGLARSTNDPKNRKVLERISADELSHYKILRHYTGKEVRPKGHMRLFYTIVSRVLGTTFGVKLMEAGETLAQKNYRAIAKELPALNKVARDEDRHERLLLENLDEEYLKYVSSIVLGINDALVELTGAMAGLTFALGKNNLVAMTGLITGIAAGFSMAAAEYLSKRQEKDGGSPLKAALYTGAAYLLTVVLLVYPYLIQNNPLVSLFWMFANAIVVIAFFTFYMTVAKGTPFKRHFYEMAGISLGVGFLSFLFGLLAKAWLGVDIK
jgi:vacuolar iron transporter family protein